MATPRHRPEDGRPEQQIAHGREVSDIGLVATNGVARLANVTDLDLNNPVTKGAVLLRAGRFPATAGEALVSPKIARAFGVGVGDELRLAEPAWSERIVGIGVLATNWNDGLIAVRGNELGAPRFQSPLDQVQQLTLRTRPRTPVGGRVGAVRPGILQCRQPDER